MSDQHTPHQKSNQTIQTTAAVWIAAAPPSKFYSQLSTLTQPYGRPDRHPSSQGTSRTPHFAVSEANSGKVYPSRRTATKPTIYSRTVSCSITSRDWSLPGNMPGSSEDRYEKTRSRRRDDDLDEGRDRKQRRDLSPSSDEGRYRRRDDRKDRSHRHRRDRSPEDSHRRRDRDDDRSHRRRRSRDHSRQRYRSNSPDPKRRKRSPSAPRSNSPPRRSRGPLPSQNDQFRGEVAPQESGDQPPKQKPNFKPTGLLAKEANTVAGTTTVLKYHEPAEARKPPAKEQWRMYVFKKKDLIDTVQLYQRSCWLCGRDQKVTDLTLEDPSISKQHAVVQFRHQITTNEYGDKSSKVKPYLIDLESANGTKLNGKDIATSRYVQLVDGDVISFGDSEREYVMMLPPP